MDLYLFQISTGNQYSKLTKTQFVQTLRQGVSFTDWLCWTPGFSSWKKLESCPDLLNWVKHNWTEADLPPAIPNEYVLSQPSIKELPVFVEIPSEKPNFVEPKDGLREDTITARVDVIPDDPTIIVNSDPAAHNNITIEFEESSTATKPSLFFNKRKHPRVKGRLRTILTNKAKAFITYSRDISLGGISVEHMIPKEILEGEIEVYISDPTGRKSVVFNCNAVGLEDNSHRFTFSNTDEKQLTKLTNWLDELSRGKAS
ncbi:MAG: PilZ domain-containing protein [Bdellovibrionota bacterium]